MRIARFTMPAAIAWVAVTAVIALAPTFNFGMWLSTLGGGNDAPPAVTAPPAEPSEAPSEPPVETPTPTPTPTPLTCDQLDREERDATVPYFTHEGSIIQRLELDSDRAGVGGSIDLRITLTSSEHLETLGCALEGEHYMVAFVDLSNRGLHYDLDGVRFGATTELDLDASLLTVTTSDGDELAVLDVMALETGFAVIYVAPEDARTFGIAGSLTLNGIIDANRERYPEVPETALYEFEIAPIDGIELDTEDTGFCDALGDELCVE